MSIEAASLNEMNVKGFVNLELKVRDPKVIFNPQAEIDSLKARQIINATQANINEAKLSGKDEHLFGLTRLLPALKILRSDIYNQVNFNREVLLEFYKKIISKTSKATESEDSLRYLSQALTIFKREELGTDLVNHSVEISTIYNNYRNSGSLRDYLDYASYIKLINPKKYAIIDKPDLSILFTPEGRQKKLNFSNELNKLSELRILLEDDFENVIFDTIDLKNLKKRLTVPTGADKLFGDHINLESKKAIICAPKLDFRDGYVLPVFNNSLISSESLSLPDRRRF